MNQFDLRTELDGGTIVQELSERMGDLRQVIFRRVIVTSEQQIRDKLIELGWTPPGPIDMVLHCPKCGTQHIDAADSDCDYTVKLHESSWWELGGEKPERWTNPPHRSHLCHACGHIWRPADVPTNGVEAVKTRGKSDS